MLLLTLAGAALVGGLTALKPTYAAALVLAAAVTLIVAVDVHSLAVFVVFVMFVESLSLGGLKIGPIVGVLAISVLALYLLAGGRFDLRPNALLVAVGGYGVWMLLSVYWATDAGHVFRSVGLYANSLAYMLAVAILVRSRRHVKAIFLTLAGGALVFGAGAFAAYVASGAAQAFHYSDRATGLQGDPNYFAVHQVIGLPAALTLVALERRPQRRWFYYATIGVVVLSVVSSLSRTGLLALVAVVLATLVLPWRVFFRRPGQKLSYAVALLTAGSVTAIVGTGALVHRVESIVNPSVDRGAGRTDIWSAAWNAYSHHPGLGIGAGNFQAHSVDLLQATPGVNIAASYVAPNVPVHDAYLETLTELGPVGLAFFLLLIGLTGWYFVRAFRRARAAGDALLERCSLSLAVALLGYMVAALFLSNELGRLLWILVGLALALEVITRRLAPAPSPP